MSHPDLRNRARKKGTREKVWKGEVQAPKRISFFAHKLAHSESFPLGLPRRQALLVNLEAIEL